MTINEYKALNPEAEGNLCFNCKRSCARKGTTSCDKFIEASNEPKKAEDIEAKIGVLKSTWDEGKAEATYKLNQLVKGCR